MIVSASAELLLYDKVEAIGVDVKADKEEWYISISAIFASGGGCWLRRRVVDFYVQLMTVLTKHYQKHSAFISQRNLRLGGWLSNY